jgi:hypothetical protein
MAVSVSAQIGCRNVAKSYLSFPTGKCPFCPDYSLILRYYSLWFRKRGKSGPFTCPDWSISTKGIPEGGASPHHTFVPVTAASSRMITGWWTR